MESTNELNTSVPTEPSTEPSTGTPQGGPVGLSPVGTPPIAPNTAQQAPVRPMEAALKPEGPTKISSALRSLHIRSILLKHGAVIQKDKKKKKKNSGGSCGTAHGCSKRAAAVSRAVAFIKASKKKRDMPGFTEQDRPAKSKEIYKALKRDKPGMPAGMKARIASRQGKPGKQKQGPPYKGPLSG
jgi:hypothetical protein